ncbi:hyperosmotically inducible periplasmic protein [Burkholderia multivorans]
MQVPENYCFSDDNNQERTDMKSTNSLLGLGAIVLATLSTNVFAQAASAPDAQAAQAASAPSAKAKRAEHRQQKKAQHAANWKLEKAVRSALTHAKGLDSSHTVVLAKGGKITLEGTVPSEDQIKIAGDAATAVSGVASVNNLLTVHQIGN